MHRYTFGLLAAAALIGASCNDDGAEPDPPGPLQVGIATVAMPVPLGIGTFGNGAFGTSGDPSPYTGSYPATKNIHGHPEFKAVAISRGPGHEVIFVRSDTIGIYQHLRHDIVVELEDRTGRDLDDALLFNATHTHNGPGRLVDFGSALEFITDSFFPEFYERMVQSVADAVELALEDLQPGRIGRAQTTVPEAHEDRRCQDGVDYTNPTLPILVVEQNDEVAAVVMAFAIHGTILGIGDFTLSQDVSGAVEHAVEDRFDHPVEALMLNSWGADMRPAHPPVLIETGAPLPSGYEHMATVGTAVADEVEIAITDTIWMDDPVIASETHRVRLDREAIGYEGSTFDYEYGAVYCGGGRDTDCDPTTTENDLDELCLPFPETLPAPNQTIISAGQLGDMHFVTFPGEPGTLLTEQILEAMDEWPDVSQVLFIGYSQDYSGYALLEEDWWQGGYESGGSLWGPGAGEYLRDKAIEVYGRYRQPGNADLLLEPQPLVGFDTTHTPLVPHTPLLLGSITADVNGTYGPTDVVTFTVAANDPWHGAPVATLLNEDGTPALRPNGVPFQSIDYTMWMSMEPEPKYIDDRAATERRFDWTVHLPATHAVAGWTDFAGRFKFSVAIPKVDGTVETVESAVFEIGT